ncbi:MAG TPA: biotin/lipoyl-containing protein, partial [Steroidobacteraceae bacterium]|nr:biotin/lipoyl-containing protein [Steroidobacteraceae bacterium]
MSSTPGSIEVRAPRDQAEGTRSQILRWLKATGDALAEHEPLVEVETDKVTIEIASPASGVLREILKQEQEEISPGDLLARIEVSAAAASATAAVGASAGAGQSTHAAAASAGSDAQLPARPRGRREPDSVSPAVRRLLQERGLSEQDVTGTGPGGRISVDDVLRTDSAAPHASAPPSWAVSGAGTASHHVAHSATRKRIAQRMVHSLLHTAP